MTNGCHRCCDCTVVSRSSLCSDCSVSQGGHRTWGVGRGAWEGASTQCSDCSGEERTASRLAEHPREHEAGARGGDDHELTVPLLCSYSSPRPHDPHEPEAGLRTAVPDVFCGATSTLAHHGTKIVLQQCSHCFVSRWFSVHYGEIHITLLSSSCRPCPAQLGLKLLVFPVSRHRQELWSTIAYTHRAHPLITSHHRLSDVSVAP
jgi:hypothetical protein